MKVRNGFVSNSSSSSFIIVTRPAGIDELDDSKVLVMIGEYGDGIGYGRPSKEIIDFLKTNRGGDYEFHYEYFSFGGEEEIDVSNLLPEIAKVALNPPKEKIFIKAFQRSHYFPEDLEEFKEAIQYED